MGSSLMSPHGCPYPSLRRMNNMGYKCPLCLQDFKHDKIKWNEHLIKMHKGIGKEIVDLFFLITESKNKEGKSDE
jgi:hypothetical protein